MLKFENPLISKIPRTFPERSHVHSSWNWTLLSSTNISSQEEFSEVLFDIYNFHLNSSYRVVVKRQLLAKLKEVLASWTLVGRSLRKGQ